MRSWTPAFLVFLPAAIGACEPELPTVNTEPLVTASEPPEVGFDLGEDAVWVTPGVLSGLAIDAEQAPSTLPLRLESSRDGLLWFGNPDGDGTWTWEGELSLGEHGLILSAEDREGNLTLAETRIQVRANTEPRCRILSPRTGDAVRVRTDVLFEGQAQDVDGDDLLWFWRSDLEGALFEGEAYTRRLTEVGVHTIELEVEDEVGGLCTDFVVLTVTP